MRARRDAGLPAAGGKARPLAGRCDPEPEECPHQHVREQGRRGLWAPYEGREDKYAMIDMGEGVKALVCDSAFKTDGEKLAKFFCKFFCNKSDVTV